MPTGPGATYQPQQAQAYPIPSVTVDIFEMALELCYKMYRHVNHFFNL